MICYRSTPIQGMMTAFDNAIKAALLTHEVAVLRYYDDNRSNFSISG
jgi:hypothetical protein